MHNGNWDFSTLSCILPERVKHSCADVLLSNQIQRQEDFMFSKFTYIENLISNMQCRLSKCTLPPKSLLGSGFGKPIQSQKSEFSYALLFMIDFPISILFLWDILVRQKYELGVKMNLRTLYMSLGIALVRKRFGTTLVLRTRFSHPQVSYGFTRTLPLKPSMLLATLLYHVKLSFLGYFCPLGKDGTTPSLTKFILLWKSALWKPKLSALSLGTPHFQKLHLFHPHHPNGNTLTWNPPPLGWLKLNRDTSIKKRKEYASISGVCRNHLGDWLLGFHQKCRVQHAFMEELQTILKGLQLFEERRWGNVIINTNSQQAVTRILQDSPPR